MNQEVNVYLVGNKNKKHKLDIPAYLNLADQNNKYRFYQAVDGDVFNLETFILTRNNQMIQMDDYLVIELDLFLKVADNYHWTMQRGIDFVCASLTDPVNKAFFYFDFLLLPRAYEFYDIAPVD